MKLEQLFEGISPVLYHYTDYRALTQILSKNRFNLVPDLGTGSEAALRKGQKFYYMSTTRHKLGGFNLEPYQQGVMIKLDGIKLGQRYSGEAVDYWGHEFRKIRPEKAEAEDRLYSEKPYIKNAKQYIDEVHVLFVSDKNTNPATTSHLRKAVIQLKKSNIPYYVYDNVRDFLVQNKAKAGTEIGQTASAPPYHGRELKWDHKDFGKWIELYNKDKLEDLSKDARELVYNMRWYSADSLNQFDAMVHNIKKKDSPLLHKYVRILRRERLKSNIEFVEMIRDKWKDRDET